MKDKLRGTTISFQHQRRDPLSELNKLRITFSQSTVDPVRCQTCQPTPNQRTSPLNSQSSSSHGPLNTWLYRPVGQTGHYSRTQTWNSFLLCHPFLSYKVIWPMLISQHQMFFSSLFEILWEDLKANVCTKGICCNGITCTIERTRLKPATDPGQ